MASMDEGAATGIRSAKGSVGGADSARREGVATGAKGSKSSGNRAAAADAAGASAADEGSTPAGGGILCLLYTSRCV